MSCLTNSPLASYTLRSPPNLEVRDTRLSFRAWDRIHRRMKAFLTANMAVRIGLSMPEVPIAEANIACSYHSPRLFLCPLLPLPHISCSSSSVSWIFEELSVGIQGLFAWGAANALDLSARGNAHKLEMGGFQRRFWAVQTSLPGCVWYLAFSPGHRT